MPEESEPIRRVLHAIDFRSFSFERTLFDS